MKRLYSVRHFHFVTDRGMPTVTKVRAHSRAEALAIYNRVARLRTEYPYCWNLATLLDVYETEPEEILE
jgi:hypothetical protein